MNTTFTFLFYFYFIFLSLVRTSALFHFQVMTRLLYWILCSSQCCSTLVEQRPHLHFEKSLKPFTLL